MSVYTHKQTHTRLLKPFEDSDPTGIKINIAYTCMHAGKPYSSLLSVEREGKSWAVLMHDCVLCRDKGVKVELGIPYELWDQPSAEITNMQRSVSKTLFSSPALLVPFTYMPGENWFRPSLF